MKTLLILRHAKSSWQHPELTDHDRPLNKRGRRDASRMGKFLRQQGLVPEKIISSTAKRARKTARMVAKASGYGDEVKLASAFYHAAPEAYITVLRNLADDFQRVMVVGHNPGMEALIARLTDHVETMPTAAIAHILLPIGKWGELDDDVEGELMGLWRPKELTH